MAASNQTENKEFFGIRKILVWGPVWLVEKTPAGSWRRRGCKEAFTMPGNKQMSNK